MFAESFSIENFTIYGNFDFMYCLSMESLAKLGSGRMEEVMLYSSHRERDT